MVQIAVNVILDHSIIINKQYYLCEKQLCTYSLLHFFGDTAPLRREIAFSRVFWTTQKNDDEVFFLLSWMRFLILQLQEIRPDLTS